MEVGDSMEYSINQLAKMSGISTRTLRHYDSIGLLKPLRINSSSYRIYGSEQVDLLQQILFYKELGFSLEEIKRIIYDPSFDKLAALEDHLAALKNQQRRLDQLINNVNKTILKEKGLEQMTDNEKFEGFKKRLIAENEAKYGKEIRDKYGDDQVNKSNAQMLKLTPEQYSRMGALGQEILTGLEQAVLNGEDPASEVGLKLAEMHKEWLSFTWPGYSPEAHAGLAEMYVADDRFTVYYDSKVPGCAKFLRDAIVAFTGAGT